MKRRLPIKAIVVISVIFLALFFTLAFTIRRLKNLDYFTIKDIFSNADNLSNLSYLKGKNIFDLDSKKESKYISEIYPDYRNVRIIRVLPNRLYIDFVKRSPMAYVKLYRFFLVDSDLVLFNPPQTSSFEDLPVILGLETKIFGPSPGTRYNIKELLFSLSVIKEFKKNKVLKDYKIKRISVANLRNASFFIALPGTPDLELKMDEGNIITRINILAGLFSQMKNDLHNIKYIDLRFKEPVIKFNEDKS